MNINNNKGICGVFWHVTDGNLDFTMAVSPGCKMSDSGNSSKLEVSSILLISIGIAAGLSLQIKINARRVNIGK